MKYYYEDKWVKIIHGDCREILPTLDVEVDLVLVDLPFGQTHNKWDVAIPIEVLWDEYNRILVPNGVIALFGNGMFTAKLMISNKSMWKYNFVWVKDRPKGFLNSKHRPLVSHEDIIIFYRHKGTYNPQFFEGIPLHGMGKKYKQGNINNNYGVFNSKDNPSAFREGDTRKYPRTFLGIFKMPHPSIHPTQKPVDLCEYIIRTFTNADDIVMDNCCGVGTTLVAASRLNRQSIGIEINERYCEIAAKRCSKEVMELNI